MPHFFWLLILFEIKHFFCDWLFQTDWMVEGKGRRRGWIAPLAAHALSHGFWTGAIILAWSRDLTTAIICGIADTFAHFVIDRIKSSPNILGKYKSTEKYFWVILGADQAAHHLTYLTIIFGFYFLPNEL